MKHNLTLSRDNALGGRAIHPLVPLLTQNRSIQVLKLNNLGLGPEGGNVLANALLESSRLGKGAGESSNLRTFICGKNRLENGSADAFGKAFAAHPNLQMVKLHNNGFFEDGVISIATGLSNCPDLRHLDLRDATSVEEDSAALRGCHALAKALRQAQHLEFLDLSDNCLGLEGCSEIVKALADGPHPALHTFYLENNDANDGIYELFSAALPKLPGLGLLGLACNDDLDGEPADQLKTNMEKSGGQVVFEDDRDDPDDIAGYIEKETRYLKSPTDLLAEMISQLTVAE